MPSPDDPHHDPAAADDPAVPGDGRQSPAAYEIRRGVIRLLLQHGISSITELPLPNGRRADVAGLSRSGGIWIVEIKSSIADFRADQKWPEYRDFSDQLYFAVKPDFPVDILPADTGLMLADRFGGEVVRPAPLMKLAAARRKSMTLRLARAAGMRLSYLLDQSLLPLIQVGEREI